VFCIPNMRNAACFLSFARKFCLPNMRHAACPYSAMRCSCEVL
jgi:hypothetical protein